MMQANDSRLFKAAKRTIRAEATLVLIIIIITSWSVYALYKLAVGGSDSILGLNFGKLTESNKSPGSDIRTANNISDVFSNKLSNLVNQPPEATQERPIFVPLNRAIQSQRAELLRQIIAARQKYSPDSTARGHIGQLVQAPAAFAALQQLQLAQDQPTTSLQRGPQNRRLATSLNELIRAKRLEQEHQQAAREVDKLNDETESNDVHNDDNDPGESELQDAETTTMVPLIDEAPPDEPPTSPTEEESSTELPELADDASIDQDKGTEDEVERAHDSEQLKDVGQDVDEEVDRMTQPTSGVASRQEKPFDYRAMVQFDDSLTGHSPRGRPTVDRIYEPGSLIARFASSRGSKNESSAEARIGSLNNKDFDLQIDHNRPLVSSRAQAAAQPTSLLGSLIGEHAPLGGRAVESYNNRTTNKRKLRNRAIEMTERPRERTKRSDEAVESRSLSKRSASDLEVRNNDSNLHDNYMNRIVHELELGIKTKPFEDDKLAHRINGRTFSNPRNSSKVKMRKLNTSGSARRSDDDDDGDDDDDDYKGRDEENSEYSERGTDPVLVSSNYSNSSVDPSKYLYLTSNDASLQDLLAQKQLLDALSQTQIPAPTDATNNHPDRNKTTAMSSLVDPQAAGSLYSIDHGLLLHPSGDEKHHRKTMKKKKHEKSKEKKKVTIAMKKGGHKKKEHKKEEKKFMKEKKFKGAKKGKKVSKGKGGQGGKKGKKFYKDKGFKKKGFKNVYHKEEFGQKKSYFDEFRDKDFKKKWKKYDDKYNYAKMKKWQAKNIKGAKKMKDQGEKFKKYDKGKWNKKFHKHQLEAKKKKSASEFD